MCYQVYERYSACGCPYYKHPVDPCSKYGRRGHYVSVRTIEVAYTCSQHSTSSSAECTSGVEALFPVTVPHIDLAQRSNNVHFLGVQPFHPRTDSNIDSPLGSRQVPDIEPPVQSPTHRFIIDAAENERRPCEPEEDEIETTSSDASSAVDDAMLISGGQFAHSSDRSSEPLPSDEGPFYTLRPVTASSPSQVSTEDPREDRRHGFYRPCYLLISLGLLTIITSLVPALCRAIIWKDFSGAFSLAQYLLAIGIFVVGSMVAIHSRKCRC